MNILKVTDKPCIEVITDESTWNEYNRFSDTHWEVKVNNVWCKMGSCKVMEDEYQNHLKENRKIGEHYENEYFETVVSKR